MIMFGDRRWLSIHALNLGSRFSMKERIASLRRGTIRIVSWNVAKRRGTRQVAAIAKVKPDIVVLRGVAARALGTNAVCDGHLLQIDDVNAAVLRHVEVHLHGGAW
jgi:hypothetical protein